MDIMTGAGLAVSLAPNWRHGPWVGGAIVAGGIAAMHYTGMAAFEIQGLILWDSALVATSIVLGAAIGAVALPVGLHGKEERWKIGGAVLLTLAICSHHFTAMGAVSIIPDPTIEVSQSALPAGWLLGFLLQLIGAMAALPWAMTMVSLSIVEVLLCYAAIIVLTGLAAAAMARWIAMRRTAPVAAALALVALGLPDGIGFVGSNVTGLTHTPSALFAQAPAMWAAVRKVASPTDRVANNPLFLKDMTLWPVNISWALMANRRSCYAGAETAIAFVPLPEARRKQIDAQFMRVFSGEGTSDDVQDLAFRYNCRVIVVTSGDGAWARDPFAASPLYRLSETEAGKWRIYARVAYARN